MDVSSNLLEVFEHLPWVFI